MHKINKYISILVVLLLGILFIAKFGAPSVLKIYIETGVGNCQKIPILCMAPLQELVNPGTNKEYMAGLRPYRFPKMEIYVPLGFSVVQEKIKRVYYKKNVRKQLGAVIYLLHEEPDFFINLFPQLKKQGIKDNYEFIKRTMYAKLNQIKNLTDAFFVIMKGIFIPDLGDQKNVKMVKFTGDERRGFINYNQTGKENYFDCNIIDSHGIFFKVYIKDRAQELDLEKVLVIISTLNKIK